MNIPDSDYIIFWSSIMEFLYTFTMGILVLYIFGPALITGKLCIYDKFTLYIMEAFGVVLIINANWNLFFQEDEVIAKIQQYIHGVQKLSGK